MELFRVIKKVIVTEKSSSERSKNKYFFEVAKDANKIEIKKAIEKAFKVTVKAVNVMNVLGKKCRYGKVSGTKMNKKKAMVTLKDGDTIEALSS